MEDGIPITVSEDEFRCSDSVRICKVRGWALSCENLSASKSPEERWEAPFVILPPPCKLSGLGRTIGLSFLISELCCGETNSWFENRLSSLYDILSEPGVMNSSSVPLVVETGVAIIESGLGLTPTV